MTDLNNLPTAELNLLPQNPLTDVGPEWIDKMTVARFAELVESGILFYDADPTALMVAAGDRLDALFALELSAPSSNRYALDHRAFALGRAVNTLVAEARGANPRGHDTKVTNVPRSIGNLEIYMAQAREKFTASARWSEESTAIIFGDAYLLTPPQVTQLIGVATGQLAAWRSENTGPRYLKLIGQRSSIRYPAVALLDWLGAL